MTALEHTFITAFDLISHLKVGDRVRLTESGRTHDMYVSTAPRLCDGAFGPPESLQVTVTFGPGRYSTEVAVEHLYRTRRGRGWVGGGKQLEKIEDPS